jgi:hypothetical protein
MKSRKSHPSKKRHVVRVKRVPDGFDKLAEALHVRKEAVMQELQESPQPLKEVPVDVPITVIPALADFVNAIQEREVEEVVFKNPEPTRFQRIMRWFSE